MFVTQADTMQEKRSTRTDSSNLDRERVCAHQRLNLSSKRIRNDEMQLGNPQISFYLRILSQLRRPRRRFDEVGFRLANIVVSLLYFFGILGALRMLIAL